MLHLLHPAVVHFAIAFLVFGGLAEAAGIFASRDAAQRLGGRLVLLGTGALLLAIPTGYLAANTVDVPSTAGDLLDAHERNGWIVLGVFFAALFWKAWHRGELPPRWRLPYALLLLVAVATTIWGAWLGAEMVYTHGVGVTR